MIAGNLGQSILGEQERDGARVVPGDLTKNGSVVVVVRSE